MGRKILAGILLLCFFVAAEAQTPATSNGAASTTAKTADPDNLAKDYFSQIMGVAISATSNLKLYQFIYDWIGTPYRLGGTSKNGVDCSGFAYQLYDKVFHTVIGNNSKNIFSMVDIVPKEDLKEGDLVFFKIHSSTISHIGVYIGDNKFAHASSSRGVMISNLDESYWKKYYYKGGRLLASLREQLDLDN